jgi:hypothetical protein
MIYRRLSDKDIQLISSTIVDLEDNTVRLTKNTVSLSLNQSSINPFLVWKNNGTQLKNCQNIEERSLKSKMF